MPDEEADKGFRDLADRGLGAAVDRVPDGEFKRFLKQAGLVGFALSVLLANVPASAAMNAVVDADTKLDMSKIELYWRVLVLFAPFVLFFGAIAYCMTTKWLPQMSGYGYVAVGAGLLLGGMWLSQAIGGLVPLDLVGGPTAGSPGGLGEYIGRVFEAYLVEYGALPVLGGAVEGAFFGYWAGVAFPPE